jgi:hypothetical protein
MKPETVDATPLSGAQSLAKEEAKHRGVKAHTEGDGDVEAQTSVWMNSDVAFGLCLIQEPDRLR